MARSVLPVLLLLLAGVPEESFTTADNTRDCNPDTAIQNPGDEKLIQNKIIHANDGQKSITSFVLPKEDFEGIRAAVKHSGGTLTAWFPIKDTCSLDSSQWWKLLLEMQKKNSQVSLTLRVNTCKLTCNLSGQSELTLRDLKLFGRGPSWWRERHPDSPCSFHDVQPAFLTFLDLPFCTKPPHRDIPSTPHHNAGHNTEWPVIDGKTPKPPATVPATQPVTAPATAPPTQPVTAPATAPATAPVTAPVTAPAAPPTTVSATTPAIPPTTASATPPTTPSSPHKTSEAQTEVPSRTVVWVVASMVIAVIVK